MILSRILPICSLATGVALLAPTFVASDQAYYVSTDGKAENSGSSESPWDIASALGGQHSIAPGSTLFLKSGVYRHPDRTWTSPGFAIALEGTAGHPIRIRPVGDGRVTLDGRVEVKPNSRYLRVEDLEITVSETARWNRQVTVGGLKVNGASDLPQGGLNILGGSDSQFVNLVIHDMNSGVGLWRTAQNAEMSGCLIYGIGAIGPDRYHGPGIYTQNESGKKIIRDNVLFGNYSTTIQAYGSSKAPVNGFLIDGNIAFAPIKAGSRQRVLIGGGQPSRDIAVTNNILYETPLQLGFSAPYNEDAVVRNNWIVLAGMSIQKFRKVEQSGNVIISATELDANRPADVFIRPNKYDSRRSHIAVINWSRAPSVKVDLGAALKPGSHYRIVNVLDYYGPAIAEGIYDGQKPLMLTVPNEERTGNGQFCAFVLFRKDAT